MTIRMEINILLFIQKGGKFVGYINKKAVKRLGSATQPEQGKSIHLWKTCKDQE